MDFEKLKNDMADLEEDSILKMINELMKDGGKDAGKAMEVCQDAMKIIGDRFENGEYFVGDLIFAGELMTEAMDIIKPALAAGSGKSVGRMIFCTVKGDLHDIGKNIVKFMLEAASFEVLDLGVNVPPEKIVQTAKEQNINIIALSGVLTLALDSMKITVEAFKAAGMRDKVKILIGGNPVSEDDCKLIGADEWAHSPQKTINICKGWASV